METNFQRIAKEYRSELDIARKYYQIIFYLNDIHVTKTELELVVYCAVMGTISTPSIRDQFCKDLDVPTSSVYNMIAKLKKKLILIKDKKHKVRVNPVILPDFNKHTDMILVIKMNRTNGES